MKILSNCNLRHRRIHRANIAEQASKAVFILHVSAHCNLMGVERGIALILKINYTMNAVYVSYFTAVASLKIQ